MTPRDLSARMQSVAKRDRPKEVVVARADAGRSVRVYRVPVDLDDSEYSSQPATNRFVSVSAPQGRSVAAGAGITISAPVPG